ncbi:MAG: peptide deformylase [Oscillospiraceae bacterium]|nr:peptide deformylase [Oscillospiraceae bacterium]MCR5173624.1 peptide deformylase [Oscillospiraceae bacterium]
MALRNILKAGEPRLKKTSRVVTDFNDRLHQLLDDMKETLLDAGGVGLAAPQVGVLRDVILVMDTNREGLSEEEQIIELINPKIVEQSGTQTGPEGCLSVPGEYGVVTRPENVTVTAQDRYGNEFTVSGYGLTARCFCHEIDHLSGILFTELAERMLTPEELESGEE